MAKYLEEINHPIYSVAKDFGNNCLLKDGSLIDDEQLWTLQNLQNLYDIFVNYPDRGDRSFTEKLHDQIINANNHDAVSRLAAEVVAVYFLFLSNVGFNRKTELVRKIRSWGNANLPDGNSLINAF